LLKKIFENAQNDLVEGRVFTAMNAYAAFVH